MNFTTSPNQPGMSSASIRTLPDNVFECEEYFNCTLIVPDMDMDNVIKGTPDMARVNITDNTGKHETTHLHINCNLHDFVYNS